MECLCDTGTVESASPGKMTGGVVLLRPFPFEQSLCLAVVLLLLPVRAYRVAAMMPDHGSRTEAQFPAALLQTPADIDIVTGNTEKGIKATDGLKARFTKGHIAAWNMFRLLVGEQDMNRTAWSIDDTLGSWP